MERHEVLEGLKALRLHGMASALEAGVTTGIKGGRGRGGGPECGRPRAGGLRGRATGWPFPAAVAGNDIPRPAARHSMGSFQPMPACFTPPMIASTEISTFSP